MVTLTNLPTYNLNSQLGQSTIQLRFNVNPSSLPRLTNLLDMNNHSKKLTLSINHRDNLWQDATWMAVSIITYLNMFKHQSDKLFKHHTDKLFRHHTDKVFRHHKELSTDKLHNKLSTDKPHNKLSTDKHHNKLSTDKHHNKLNIDKLHKKLNMLKDHKKWYMLKDQNR